MLLLAFQQWILAIHFSSERVAEANADA
eukprot:COSAG06_NODE_34682_length_471_cov_0.639785_1_plen_27_part_10